MTNNSMQPEEKQSKERVTCEFKRGVLTSILTEGPLGTKKKETFDANGKVSELYIERQDKTWKHDIYNDGVKVTCIEFNGQTTSTVVLNSDGHVTAADEE